MGICGSTPAVKQDAKPAPSQNGHMHATPQVSAPAPHQQVVAAPVVQAHQDVVGNEPVAPKQVTPELVSDQLSQPSPSLFGLAGWTCLASVPVLDALQDVLTQSLSAEPILSSEPILLDEPQATIDFNQQSALAAPRLLSEVD